MFTEHHDPLDVLWFSRFQASVDHFVVWVSYLYRTVRNTSPPPQKKDTPSSSLQRPNNGAQHSADVLNTRDTSHFCREQKCHLLIKENNHMRAPADLPHWAFLSPINVWVQKRKKILINSIIFCWFTALAVLLIVVGLRQASLPPNCTRVLLCIHCISTQHIKDQNGYTLDYVLLVVLVRRHFSLPHCTLQEWQRQVVFAISTMLVSA